MARVSWRQVLVLAALLFLGGISSAATYAGPSAQGLGAAIRLRAATFVPTRGEAPNVPPGLTIREYAQGQRGYYIVQFVGPVEQAWKDAVAAAGGEILDYIPDFAFKVRMTPAEARRVEASSDVAWVGLFHPAYKLSPTAVRGGTRLYRVRVERGVNVGAVAAAVAAQGATVVRGSGNTLLVGANAAQLDAIAHVLDVAWIENYTLREKHNESGAGVIIGTATANANGYDGSTQTAAVADTGLGNGTATGAHPDIPAARVTAIYNWPGASDNCWTITDDGAVDVDSGHGTHVAGSVLSDGGVNGVGKGGAPAAKLVFQATENWATMKGICALYNPDGYYLTGIPDDLRQLFQQAYDAGARIHANSWGSDAAGDYTADSAYADDFVWMRRDMTITFSAGNSGTDANNDGVVDNDSIGSPATAKNVITVGASENQRSDNFPCDTSLTYPSRDAYQVKTDGTGKTCSEMNGWNELGTWGQRYADRFKAEPIKSDLTAGNQHQMAGWSSRGPTDDGRIKPDVVAPGVWILSGYSGMYQEGYGTTVNPKNGFYQWDGYGMPMNTAYKYMGGTSMSNPIAAGGATVVRDFYKKAHSLDASAALVKATLINSAVDLLDENNDGANDNDYPIPNVHEGWGRVDIANATDGSHKFVDQTTGLSTNGVATWTFSVNTSKPVKVSLVWSDAPSTETASKNLVNDLDLVVTAPNGTTVYRGNNFSGGWSTTSTTLDRTNNVENVYVQSAATGTWKVEVKGYNVANGPQPFALVVDGADSGLTAGGGAQVAHVGDLDGTKAKSGSGWKATVTIAVHNTGHGVVNGATVSGTWSNGYSATATCTTSSSGTCSVTTPRLANSTASVTFTVNNVSATGYTYNATLNHDVDGETNGTTITVTKP